MQHSLYVVCPSLPTILFTMATKNRDLHTCVLCVHKASAHVGEKAVKKTNSKKQYKIKSDCFRQTECNMLCFNIKHFIPSFD